MKHIFCMAFAYLLVGGHLQATLPALIELKGHTNGVNSAAYSPDGKQIVSVSDDRTVRIWDAESGKELRRLAGRRIYASSAIFSPDGMKILTNWQNESVRIWDAHSGKQLRQLERRRGLLDRFSRSFMTVIPEFGEFAAFSPDGKKIVITDGRTATVWDADSGKELQKSKEHPHYIPSVAFSPDGKRIVTACRDGIIRIWSLE
jgi:WD40 repeat protein